MTPEYRVTSGMQSGSIKVQTLHGRKMRLYYNDVYPINVTILVVLIEKAFAAHVAGVSG